MNGVDGVLSGLGVTVKPEELEACQGELQQMIKKSDKGVNAIQGCIANIEKHTEHHFLYPMKTALATLVAAAFVIVAKYREWHARALKAFIRKDGDWATAIQEAQKWNERFAGFRPQIILENWDRFGQQEEPVINQLQSLLLKELESILHEAKAREPSQQGEDYVGIFEALIRVQLQRL